MYFLNEGIMEDQEVYSVESDEIVYGYNLNFTQSIELLNKQLNRKSVDKLDVYIQGTIDFFYHKSLVVSLCGGDFQTNRELKSLLRKSISKPLKFPRKKKTNA